MTRKSIFIVVAFGCFSLSVFAQTTKPATTTTPAGKPATPAMNGKPADTTQKKTAVAPAAAPAKPGVPAAAPAKPGAPAPAPAKPGAPATPPAKPAAPPAKPGTVPGKTTGTPGKPGTPVKIAPDTNKMRDDIKRCYNNCFLKRDYPACDSAVYWGNTYFAAIKSVDAYPAYMRTLAAFHKLNNMLNDEAQKFQGKSTSGIKNLDAAIAAMSRERKDEFLKIAEAATTEVNWFLQNYGTEEKSDGRLQDVKQKQYMIEDFTKKLKK